MVYVIIQFFCIFYLIFNAKFTALNTYSSVLFAVAIIIGLLSIFNMKISNLNITPNLKDNHKLVMSGIYQYIRHPMYTSVILLCLGLMLTNSHTVSQIIMLVLFVDLVLKSNVEERFLMARFSQYQQYQQSTGRFLPTNLGKTSH